MRNKYTDLGEMADNLTSKVGGLEEQNRTLQRSKKQHHDKLEELSGEKGECTLQLKKLEKKVAESEA